MIAVGGGVLVLLVVAVAAAAVLPRVLGKRAQMQRRWLRVHLALAARSGLSEAEAALVWRLGVAAELDNPALLFVRPSLFESRAQMAAADPELVRSIRAKLYDG